jgi:hypothetical protein
MGERGGGYLANGRLQDVLALIQVLGLAPSPRCSEKQLADALQGSPASRLERWSDVAEQHPEFFRVAGQKRDSVSLAARHAAGETEEERRLPLEFVQRLMQTAVDIHDREARRGERWTLYLPLVIAVIGAVGALVTALVGLLGFKG